MHAPVTSPSSRRWIVTLGLILAPAASLPGAAVAEPPANTPDAADADVTRYHFDDDLVRGGVPAPAAEHLYVRRRSERESLVRVRTQFVDELLKSAEHL